HDVDGQALTARVDGFGPGSAVAAVGVGFHKDEVGARLDGDQADGRAVEVLVGAQDDVLGSHAALQRGALLFGKEDEVVLQVQVKGVQGAVGRADEVVEFGQLQEGADVAEAAGALVVEDQQQGQDGAAEKRLPGPAAEEADEVLVQVLRVVLAEPVTQG